MIENRYWLFMWLFIFLMSINADLRSRKKVNLVPLSSNSPAAIVECQSDGFYQDADPNCCNDFSLGGHGKANGFDLLKLSYVFTALLPLWIGINESADARSPLRSRGRAFLSDLIASAINRPTSISISKRLSTSDDMGVLLFFRR